MTVIERQLQIYQNVKDYHLDLQFEISDFLHRLSPVIYLLWPAGWLETNKKKQVLHKHTSHSNSLWVIIDLGLQLDCQMPILTGDLRRGHLELPRNTVDYFANWRSRKTTDMGYASSLIVTVSLRLTSKDASWRHDVKTISLALLAESLSLIALLCEIAI